MWLRINMKYHKILTIAAVISILSATTSTALRDCESEIPGIFDTSCDGNFIHSIPLCGAGQMLNHQCVRDALEACASCEPDHYQPYHNNCSKCRRCTMCTSQQRTIQSCTADEDTKCENVDPIEAVPSSPDISSSHRATAPPKTVAPSIPTINTNLATGGTSIGTSVAEPITGKAQEGSTFLTTPNGDYVSKGGLPLTVIALAVTSALAIIFALLFVITLVCCLHYRRKCNAPRRRDLNGNQPLRDIELNRPPRECPDDQGQQPAQPPCLNDAGQQLAQPPCHDNQAAEAMPQCPPHQEPVYAIVDRAKKSREAKAADPERVQSVPLKGSGDSSQRPSSSSTRQSHPVCKTLRKVFGRDGERAARNKREPSSEVEKDALLPSHAGSSKCNPKPKSPKTSLHLEDDHIDEPGDSSKESPLMNSLTIPPLSASSIFTPSPPLPSPLPSEAEPMEQLSRPPPPSSSSSSSPQSASPSVSHLDMSNSSDKGQLGNITMLKEESVEEEGNKNKAHGGAGAVDEASKKASRSRVTEDRRMDSEGGAGSLPSETPGAKPKVKEGDAGKGGIENEPEATDATEQEHDTGGRRVMRGGASSLPSVTPGAKPKEKGLDPEDDAVQKTEKELKTPSTDPDEVVTEPFLDEVTDVVNIEMVERISRKLGLGHVIISNIQWSSSNNDPKAIGFQILRAVRDKLGCKLTYRCMLETLKDCGQKNAGDKLISEFRINMDLGKKR